MQWITIQSVVDCLYKQAPIPGISEARLYVMVYSKHERNVTNQREVMRVFICLIITLGVCLLKINLYTGDLASGQLAARLHVAVQRTVFRGAGQ